MERKTLSRREFMAVSAAVGATILTGKLSEAAQEKTMTKTFTILHTNDMHSAFIGMGPASDYTPFTLNDDKTRGGYARLAGLIAKRKEERKDKGPVLLLDAGDFMMVEWMYELENDSCADPYQPGIVNCLDGLMKTVHSVVSVWERRAWFARLLRDEHERRGGQLSVLDLAAGGARYLRDFLGSMSFPNQVRVTVVDQDAAAVEFCRRRSLAPWSSQIRFECAPIRDFTSYVPTAPFDVILSAGLFDYLDGTTATALLRQMTGWLSPSGTLAISNFHPDDPSALVKSWLVNWPVVFREEHECAELFPRDVSVRVTRSANRALCFATAVRHDE